MTVVLIVAGVLWLVACLFVIVLAIAADDPDAP